MKDQYFIFRPEEVEKGKHGTFSIDYVKSDNLKEFSIGNRLIPLWAYYEAFGDYAKEADLDVHWWGIYVHVN